MQSFTFGSEEGFDAVHEAMMKYITQPLLPNSKVTRGAFHTSFNLNDATMLINLLEFMMMNGALQINEARAAGDEVSAQQLQVTLEWAEQYYRDLAGTVGVELV